MPNLSERRFLELKATGELPSPTGVALKVLENLQNKQVSSADITSVIQADPALAGRLIKLANSLSDYSVSGRPTVSLADTINRVGSSATKHITLGLSVLSKNMEGKCEGFDYENFWSFSLAVGIAAELLSERDGLFPRDEAFTVGLLSNVGRLALANVYPEQYTGILRGHDNKPITELLKVEQQHFYTDHLEMTHAMLKDWGLPPVHYDAIHGVYEIEKLSNRNNRVVALAQYLNISTRLASLCINGYSRDHEQFKALEIKAVEFGFESQELELLFEKTLELWTDWGKLLEVPLHEVQENSFQIDDTSLIFEDAIIPMDLEQTIECALNILIVDSDKAQNGMLEKLLCNAGHRVTSTLSGKDALQIALETQPQLIISDLDGLELCRSLRKTRQGQKTYIIILTAKTDEESLVQAFRAGVDDFIEKPIRPNIVMARIRGGQRVYQLQEMIKDERRENRRILEELSTANSSLEQAALTDPLTNIPNRRYATNRLEQEWASSGRDNAPLSCMLIDIDHFKSLNDNYGHDAGDAVLYKVAQELRSAARVGDEVCRIGGEEFLVICANTTSEAAEATAERLRKAIDETVILFNDIEHHLTISIGVATRTAKDETTSDLLKSADIGVYLAKAKGRNCVCICHNPEDNSSSDLRKNEVAPQPHDVVAIS